MKAGAPIVALLMAIPLAALGSSAQAEPEPWLIVYATPERAQRGDTVQIHVEALAGAAWVDATNVTARVVGYDGNTTDVTLEPAGTGRFVGDYALPTFVKRIQYPNIVAEGMVGGMRVAANGAVKVTDLPLFVESGLMLFGQLFGEGRPPYQYHPGDAVHYRIWTYVNGTLEDVPTPRMAGSIWPVDLPIGSTTKPFFGNFTRAAVGVYDVEFVLPTDVRVSTLIYVSATVPGIEPVYGAAFEFFIHPVVAVAVVEGMESPAPAVRVCASDGDRPLQNASVKITALWERPEGSASAIVNYSTAADGCVRHEVGPRDGKTSKVTAAVEVRAFGNTTFLSVRGDRNEWNPDAHGEPDADNFSARLLDDPGSPSPGETVVLSFATTLNGAPYASQPLGVVAVPYRYSWVAPVFVGEVETDSGGLLNFSFVVPDDWTFGDFMMVKVYSPQGVEHVIVVPQYGGNDLARSGPDGANLSVSATQDHQNNTLHISGNYTGPQDLRGWTAVITVTPVGVENNTNSRMDGDFPWTFFEITGTVIGADIELPGWIWEGDYLVRLTVSTRGRAASYDLALYSWNSTVVHLGPTTRPPVVAQTPGAQPPPVTSPPSPQGTTKGPVVSGDWAFAWLIAILLGASAALFALVRYRQRRPPPM